MSAQQYKDVSWRQGEDKMIPRTQGDSEVVGLGLATSASWEMVRVPDRLVNEMINLSPGGRYSS